MEGETEAPALVSKPAMQPCDAASVQPCNAPVLVEHALRHGKRLDITCQLPLETMERMCLRLPADAGRGNLAGAFIPSNLGVRVKRQG